MDYLAFAPFIAAGSAAGALYFLMLYRTVVLYAAGGGPATVVPLYVARMVAAALFFWAVAHEGAVPLLLALAGFLLARSIAQYLVKRA